MEPHILAIIQARMSASRLPGKVLLDIAGEPMLARVVERARRAQTIAGVVVATTRDPSDDAVEIYCAARGYPCYRGSPDDVLDRYYQAALHFQADMIVRLTADCPVIDPGLTDETVHALFERPKISVGNLQKMDPRSRRVNHYDFAANRLPPPWQRTYPIGLDTEVCTFKALERAWTEAREPYHREHVMPYFYEGISPEQLRGAPRASAVSPRGFRVVQINHHPDYGHLRWTVDTPEDLELLRQIYGYFAGRDDFSWLDVLALFERHPELRQVNAAIRHKTAFEVDERK